MNKNKKSINSLLLIFLLIPLTLLAETLSENEVKSAVETWVSYVTADAKPNAIIQEMEAHIVDGEVVAYIAHLSGEGFCLCGADELVLPVYLYCAQGSYDPQDPNLQYILWEIQIRTKKLRDGNIPKLPQFENEIRERTSFWQNLSAGIVPPRIDRDGDRVEPQMMELNFTSLWSQGGVYNDQCPTHVNSGQNTVVGCGATSMSQIMYYWKWPNSGVGNGNVNYESRWRNNWDNEPLAVDPNIPGGWGGRLQWTAAGGGQLEMNGDWDGSFLSSAQNISADANYQNALQTLYNNLNTVNSNWAANFGATNYQWSIIDDQHNGADPAGDAEVAEICYHAGIAINMSYGLRSSSASFSQYPTAMEDHFRYDPNAIHENRDIDKMTEDILWLRPLDLNGTNTWGGGHFWVVYGYNKATDPARQFKMNFGWGGARDNWYSCDFIGWDEDGDGIDDAHFSVGQTHTTKLAPLDVVKFVGEANPGDGTPNDPYEDIEEAIAEAPDNSTLIFKAGSNNTFSTASLEIDKPLVLKGYNAVIQSE